MNNIFFHNDQVDVSINVQYIRSNDLFSSQDSLITNRYVCMYTVTQCHIQRTFSDDRSHRNQYNQMYLFFKHSNYKSASCAIYELKSLYFLKLLSQPWWILIPKIKTNQNKHQYFTDNHNQQNASLNVIDIPRCRQKNVKITLHVYVSFFFKCLHTM